jgi:hypothetical protein
VFGATYNGGSDSGIFTSNGGILSSVIDTGDTLFGSTVTSLSFDESGLDDSGNIAFSYTLSDGRSGVAIADFSAVPEPASLCILGFGASMLLARRRNA